VLHRKRGAASAEIDYRVWRSVVSFPSGLWGAASAEIDYRVWRSVVSFPSGLWGGAPAKS